MRVVFAVYGYCPEAEPLQPWLTIRNVAHRMLASGWGVHVLTDHPAGASSLPEMQVHILDSMRPGNRTQVLEIIRSLRPGRLIVLPNPMSLAVPGWYPEIEADIYAFLSYPFYTRMEVLRAIPYLNSVDIKTYGRHTLVPEFLWGANLGKYFRGVIGQSERTTRRVYNRADQKVEMHPIPAGIDLDFWSPADGVVSNGGTLRYLYLGSARPIRGFKLVLKAFYKIADSNVHLRILARSASDVGRQKINSTVSRLMKGDISRVSVKSGWLDPVILRDEIRSADVVVLPFVLVPSELPVSVMECVACGTPVITTDIDGLPEAIGDGGWVVRSASLASLLVAMKECRDSSDILMEKHQACLEQRSHMKSWPVVAEQWMSVLE